MMGAEVSKILIARAKTFGIVSVLGLTASITQVAQLAAYAQSAPQSRSSIRSSGAKLSGHINFNKYSGAESGVQLLDSIFSRVSNIPQVASIQQQVTQTQQRLANKDVSKDSVDYKLAIRPKESGKPFTTPTPSLQISDKNGPVLAYDQGQVNLKKSMQSAAGASSSALDAEDFDESRQVKIAKKPSADVWKGNTKYLNQITANSAYVAPTYGDESAPKNGVWDRNELLSSVNDWNGAAVKTAGNNRADLGASLDSVSSGRSAGAGLPQTNMGKFVHQASEPLAGGSARGFTASNAAPAAPPSPRYRQQTAQNSYADAQARMPQLANSLGRLYNLNKGLEGVQDYADSLSQAPAPQGMSGSAGAGSMTMASAKRKASAYASAREIQVIDERPSVRDMREAPSIALAPKQQVFAPEQSALRNSPAPSPRPAVSGQLARKLETKSNEKARAKEEALKESDAPAEKKRDMLALLPPNVATGIPLVSLGTSQTQAMHALSAIGQVKEQKIGKWNVVTWKKKDASSTSLQLFFRHGLLDAMRIFDPSLIAPDFGAQPGANLEAVKERFGEPAFLLPEPNPGIGQNYVYPISQVGFQFARPDKDAAPQVVSVLIFSVK